MDMNPGQQALADLPIGNVLVIAPAGCGKTEALAGRAAAVLQRAEVALPRKVLGLTFSKKARDNLARRMAGAVGPRWRRQVTVSNFHGLAARVIKAHGHLLGIPADIALPDEAWKRRQLRDLGVYDFPARAPFDAALHKAKFGRFDDDEVMSRLQAAGNGAAIKFESRLQDEGRLDHDDVLRHGGRLLELEDVKRLYRAHFGLVLVDEIQDLTVVQYDLVRAVGGDRVTYAGDPAQGIYSFAGADPMGVLERIERLEPERVELNISYRSAPAVLEAVNILAREMGATELECGAPDVWPDEGHVVSLEREDTASEAEAVLQMVLSILSDKTDATIGVIGRRGARFQAVQQAADEEGLDYEDWSLATHSPTITALLRRGVEDALRGAEGVEVIDELERLCREMSDPSDVSMLDDLAVACDDLRMAVVDGVSPADAIASLRTVDDVAAPVAAGFHLLTGHRGKGQEFDWVVVVGLEEGHVPDFRSSEDEELQEELRVLHVMVSRARYGVVVTRSRYTLTRYGWRGTQASPWLGLLRSVATRTDHA